MVLVGAVGIGQQLAQNQIARMVAGNQQQPERRIAVVRVFDPGIHANNWLDALASAGFVKLDHAKQVGQIGNPQSRHAIGRSAAHSVIQTHNAVGDGKLGMEAEVYKARGSHRGILPRVRNTQTARLAYRQRCPRGRERWFQSAHHQPALNKSLPRPYIARLPCSTPPS